MKKGYLIGIFTGFVLLLLAMPLGELYGKIFTDIGTGMVAEQYTMLMKQVIISFQIIGTLISTLSGLAYVFDQRN